MDFLRKRFLKVYVPYAIAVALWGVWLLVSKGSFPIKEVASHLLLYKMFSEELDTSLCYPYWFISTIIQFYLAWPLIVRLVRGWGGYFIALGISIVWSTLVGVLGYEELRPWGSLFLQYLWEFCLGMWIAEKIYRHDKIGGVLVASERWKLWWLLIGVFGGMGLSAMMAWNGGWLKLYNDIPSLVGYLSVMLLIYKIGVKLVNRFFVWASGFGYELYLVHSLVFVITAFYLKDIIPVYLLLVIRLLLAYAVGYGYSRVLKMSKLK